MNTKENTKEIETEEQRFLRHDTHFLHQLQQAGVVLGRWPKEVRYTEPTPWRQKNNDRDLRFNLSYFDEIEGKKSHIQIGVGLVTRTGLFNTGSSVVHFFAFYPHKRNPDDEWETGFLYSTALFIYRRPWFGAWFGKQPPEHRLKPFKQTWWQRFVKGFNDLGQSRTTPLWSFAKHADQNPETEEALIATVFKAIETTGKQDRAKAILRVQL